MPLEHNQMQTKRKQINIILCLDQEAAGVPVADEHQEASSLYTRDG